MSDYSLDPEALADIDAIWEYIASDSVDAPTGRSRPSSKALQLWPHPRGRVIPDRILTSAPLLFWRVYSYLIVYAPAEQPLFVIAVIHGQRSPRVIATILRERH